MNGACITFVLPEKSLNTNPRIAKKISRNSRTLSLEKPLCLVIAFREICAGSDLTISKIEVIAG
jgi:hypothetical protein